MGPLYSREISGSINIFQMEIKDLDSSNFLNSTVFDDLKQGIGRTKQIELGDSHGTFFKALNAAICAGWVSFNNENNPPDGLVDNNEIVRLYNRFVKLSAMPPDLITITSNDPNILSEYDEIKSIISRLTRGLSYPADSDNPEKNTVLSLLIDGDLTADRGFNDLYTKLTKSHFRNILKIQTPEVASNHWFQAVCPEEKTISDETKFISALNEQVLLTRLIKAKKITQKEFDLLNDEDLETIQLIAYKIDIDDTSAQITDIHLTAHAPEGTALFAVRALAEYFKILDKNENIESAFHLGQIIEALNAKFKETIKSPKERALLFKKMTQDYHEGTKIDYETVPGEEEEAIQKQKRRAEHPFYSLFWSPTYKDSDVKWNPLKNDVIIPTQSFGHIGQECTQYHPSMNNMDGHAGMSQVVANISSKYSEFKLHIIFDGSSEQLSSQNSSMTFKIPASSTDAIEYTILIKKTDNPDTIITGHILPDYDFLYNKIRNFNTLAKKDKAESQKSILTLTALRHRLEPTLCRELVKPIIGDNNGIIIEGETLNPLAVSSSYRSIDDLKKFLTNKLIEKNQSNSYKINESDLSSFTEWCQLPSLKSTVLERRLEELIYESLSIYIDPQRNIASERLEEFVKKILKLIALQKAPASSIKTSESTALIDEMQALIRQYKTDRIEKINRDKINALISKNDSSQKLKAHLLKSNNWKIADIDMSIALRRAEKEKLREPNSLILKQYLEYMNGVFSLTQNLRKINNSSLTLQIKKFLTYLHESAVLKTFEPILDTSNSLIISIIALTEKEHILNIKQEDFNWLLINCNNVLKIIAENQYISEQATSYLNIILKIATDLKENPRNSFKAQKARRMNKILSTLNMASDNGKEALCSFEKWFYFNIPEDNTENITVEQRQIVSLMNTKIFDRIKTTSPPIFDLSNKSDDSIAYSKTMQKWTKSLGKMAALQVEISRPLTESNSSSGITNSKNLLSQKNVTNLFESIDNAAELAWTGEIKAAQEDFDLTNEIIDLSLEYYKEPFDKIKYTDPNSPAQKALQTIGKLNKDNSAINTQRAIYYSAHELWRRITGLFVKLERKLEKILGLREGSSKDKLDTDDPNADLECNTESAKLIKKTAIAASITFGFPRKEPSKKPVGREYTGTLVRM